MKNRVERNAQKKHKVLPIVSVALGVFAFSSLPARCDDPRVKTVGAQAIYTDNCTNCAEPIPIDITKSGPESWQVKGGLCETIGQDCEVTYGADKDHKFYYLLETGTYYQGMVTLQLRTEAPPVPKCQNSTPPTCPTTPIYAYQTYIAFNQVPWPSGNCYCDQNGTKHLTPR